MNMFDMLTINNDSFVLFQGADGTGTSSLSRSEASRSKKLAFRSKGSYK